jgi:CrcB protein
MSFLMVGIGGMLGSVARYDLGMRINKYSKSAFPYATFIINITGALLLGIVSAMHDSGQLYLLLGEGFLGAFTTFSTFMYEGVNLIKDNKHLNAFLYIIATVIIGSIGFVIGYYWI